MHISLYSKVYMDWTLQSHIIKILKKANFQKSIKTLFTMALYLISVKTKIVKHTINLSLISWPSVGKRIKDTI